MLDWWRLQLYLQANSFPDSYDALPNCSSSKQTTPTTARNPSFGSLSSQPMMNGSNDNSIYKCSSDCCSMERQQRNNHSHFNHTGSNNNNKRKQKTKHHHRQNNISNHQKHHHSPQEYHNHSMETPDQNHANYEYIIGDESHCDDESSCNLGKVTISENDETTEHEEDDIGNSYSCDDTLTDDAVLSTKQLNPRANQKIKICNENESENSQKSGSGGDGETCCSCSDESCVYEEPPSHPIQLNTNKILRVAEEV